MSIRGRGTFIEFVIKVSDLGNGLRKTDFIV
jgi:hypothetical protein